MLKASCTLITTSYQSTMLINNQIDHLERNPEESERIQKGKPRYTKLFKSEVDLWAVHNELLNLPLNFYHSILLELKVTELDYYENIEQMENFNEKH